MPRSECDDYVDHRIGQLEEEVKGLTRESAEMRIDIREQTVKMDHVVASLSDLKEQLKPRKGNTEKIIVALIGGASAFAVAVFTGVINLFKG